MHFFPHYFLSTNFYEVRCLVDHSELSRTRILAKFHDNYWRLESEFKILFYYLIILDYS